MKTLILLSYRLLSWLVILVLFLLFLLLFILESPSAFFKLAQSPLKEQGISYSKIEGSLLSGFVLHDVNYQDQVKAKSLALEMDLHALENRVLHIDKLIVEEAQVDKAFLASLIDDNSSSSDNNETNSTLPFDKVFVKHLDFSLVNTTYDVYHVNRAKITLNDLETDMKEAHKAKVNFVLDSNVTQLTLDASIDNNTFKLAGTLEGEQLFIEPFLSEHETTLLSNPSIDISADGSLKNINFKVNTEALDLKYQQHEVHTKVLTAAGNYDLNKNALTVDFKNIIESDIATFDAKGDVDVELDDVNNTLNFNLLTKLEPKEKLLEEKLLIEQLVAHKIEINQLPLITSWTTGSMQHIDFETKIKDLKASQEKLTLWVKTLDLKGDIKPIQGETTLLTTLSFDSSVAQGDVVSKSRMNLHEAEETLEFNVNSSLRAYDSYLNPLLKESNISLEGDTLVNLTSSGSLNAIKMELDLSSMMLTEGIRSKVALKTDAISLDLKEEVVHGSLSLNSNARNLALNFQSEFSGKYMEPKKLLSNSTVNISKFNAFNVNLTELLPLSLKLKTQTDGANVKLEAQKLRLSATTSDYDNVKFSLNSEKIYPAKIVEVPSELKNKFVLLNLNGQATLSKQYFTLKGALESNNKFKANIDAYSQADGLNVNVFTKHLKVNAKGNLEKKAITASVKIDSLEKLQKELQTLYPFTSVPIEGAVHLDAQLQGEKVRGTLGSDKLVLEGFNVEDLEIDADYEGTLVSIHKLNFKTTGFEDSALNKDFYLNKKGLVNLGEKKEVLLDMHPKILLKGEGTAENLDATFQIEELFLGYPEYGSTKLSCDIDYRQRGKKKKIIGGIFLDKMKISYESKFLDPSSDNDVVIIRKEDKKKKAENGSFLEDTFIDVMVYAEDVNYRTRDIDLSLDLNVKAQKAFGKGLVMLGKVQEIEGRVEQAPKLFTVVDSNIVFQGGKEINPLLDLTVEHELPEILITINIHGNAKRPKLTFTSEPPLPKKDILSYLLLGVSTASLGEGEGSLGREAQLFIMNQAARDLAYEVELDRVFVKDDGTGEGYAVQVGKKIEEDTMFIIENSTEGNSFILEYDVNRNIKVEVGQHQKTVPSQSIDLYFRKKFK